MRSIQTTPNKEFSFCTRRAPLPRESIGEPLSPPFYTDDLAGDTRSHVVQCRIVMASGTRRKADASVLGWTLQVRDGLRDKKSGSRSLERGTLQG